MSESNRILWKKDELQDSAVYIELFADRGYEIHTLTKYFDVEDPDEYADKSAKIWIHCLDSKRDVKAEAHRMEGKKLFTQGKYFDAMKEFNIALRFAQNFSDEVGLAYANRSSCFFFLNMFDECLVDIELAKDSRYPVYLTEKLNERIRICNLVMLNNQRIPKRLREPLLSFKEHKEFPGAAECLEIRKNDKYGQHIVTTRDLEIGQTILVEEPYSITTFSESKGRDRCMHCFKECRNFIPCTSCVNGLFCDEKCMNKSSHKYNCMLWVPEPDKHKFKLVMETFFKISVAFPNFNSLMNTTELLIRGRDAVALTNEQRKFARLFQLIHNHERISADKLESLRIVANHCFYAVVKSLPGFMGKFVDVKKRRFLQHLMFHLCHITEHEYFVHEYLLGNANEEVSACAFDIYASGMYLFGDYINHSCVPNVLYFTVDDRLVCKVIRPIKCGEQLFRCYT